MVKASPPSRIKWVLSSENDKTNTIDDKGDNGINSIV